MNSPRKTRLAFVLTQTGGGPVDVTVGLARWFAQHPDYEVRLFAPRPDRDADTVADVLEESRVEGKLDVKAIRRARHRILAWRPDVVHAQDRRSGLVCAGLGRRGRGSVVVHTYHGVPDDVSQPWLLGEGGPRPSRYTIATLAADAAVARKVDHTVVVAQVMGRFLQRRLRVPEHRVTHISNGLWLPSAQPTSGPVRRLLFVGALIERKGIGDLVAAMAVLRDRGRRLELDVVGDGPQRTMLEEQAIGLGLGDHISFLGFREDVHALLGQADAFVLPSLMEQQPLVLIEAMAAAKLVVATDCGGVRQMLADAGPGAVLVPPGQPDALADAITSLTALADPQRAALEVSSVARDQYSVERCAQRHASLYSHLLAARAPSRERTPA